MLELRPNCECCDRDLPPTSADAWICSFECTFCATCVLDVLHGVCPNCGGNFAPRPIRPDRALAANPPSGVRVTSVSTRSGSPRAPRATPG
ncbi:DUF1272 domain-containing protein [Pengzhenrongella frigida]|uniref:DUF1272 domain-containing protein n=1 Tax=Pengzhenrongella frigida TaxID=1259133 RepID=A0A4Q5N3P7_9MICO|nr:DUF1272 domain-containing protein [Cellulomonas sp. HLT2-17]RYV52785.1 DUF1272 domain-containing protein [Cellulomonas sp. HLT2-17]